MNCIYCRHKLKPKCIQKWENLPGLLFGEPVLITEKLMREHAPIYRGNNLDTPGLVMLNAETCMQYDTNLPSRPLSFTEKDIQGEIGHFLWHRKMMQMQR